ncbi:ferredoxin [Cumulibacter manganitolerans]|uniref:ferredoxin n=1 Tax=Cumulibacter manganitolerans TaxID=1884992 RepID=UPI00129713E5|nr:ferredoxin [Cumulibacter manganitolerans]
MRISCNYGVCTGNGLCEEAAPDYFEIQDNGDLLILREDVATDDVPEVERAVAGCPTQALTLDDET